MGAWAQAHTLPPQPDPVGTQRPSRALHRCRSSLACVKSAAPLLVCRAKGQGIKAQFSAASLALKVGLDGAAQLVGGGMRPGQQAAHGM